MNNENIVIQEPKKKGNKTLIIFLILIILGLVGYITYDKVLKDKYFSKDKTKETDKNKKENTEKKDTKKTDENNKVNSDNKDETFDNKNPYVGAYGFENLEEDIYGELYLRDDNSFYYYVGDGNATSRYVGKYILDDSNNKITLNIKYTYGPNGNYYSNNDYMNGIINNNTISIEDIDYNTTNNFVKGAIEPETIEHRNNYTVNP